MSPAPEMISVRPSGLAALVLTCAVAGFALGLFVQGLLLAAAVQARPLCPAPKATTRAVMVSAP